MVMSSHVVNSYCSINPCLHGHIKVLTGHYAYFELKVNLTDSLVIHTREVDDIHSIERDNKSFYHF